MTRLARAHFLVRGVGRGLLAADEADLATDQPAPVAEGLGEDGWQPPEAAGRDGGDGPRRGGHGGEVAQKGYVRRGSARQQKAGCPRGNTERRRRGTTQTRRDETAEVLVAKKKKKRLRLRHQQKKKSTDKKPRRCSCTGVGVACGYRVDRRRAEA